jgi:aryl-alcohol dehydrogenase
VIGVLEAAHRLERRELSSLWRRGEFPVDRMMVFYDFEEIDRAAREAESGQVIKPVLRIGREGSE